MSTAVVVGGGPNGLAAAIALAAEGVSVTVLEAADEVGGGARSSEAILPGLLHDHCSAIHPMAVGSPFLSKFNLDRYGLTWRWPDVDCVHPLDGGSAGVLHRSVEQTAAGLGRDGSRWQRAFGYSASRFDALNEDIMGPLLRIPHHPLMLARFGAPTVLPASTFARVFRTEEGRALFGGVAAHAFRPLHYPMTSAIGMGIISAGHRHGWVVAEGGSRSITNAMVALLTDLGGKIETGIQDRELRRSCHRQMSRCSIWRQARSPASSAIVCRAEFRVPSLSSGVVRVHSRSTSPSTAACPGRTRTRVGRARCTWSVTIANWRPPSGRSTRDACPSGRSCWSGSNIWPIRNARSATFTRCGATHMCPTAFQRRCDRGDHCSDRAVRARLPGSDRRDGRPDHHRIRFLQPQLRRRRHHDRRQGHSSADLWAANHAVAVPHWGARYVHLLGGHPTRTRGARHVRSQRSPTRARLPGAAGVTRSCIRSGRRAVSG